MDTSFSLFSEADRKLLPACSKPLQDELFSSWLTRMSQDHGLNIFEFCNLCWPKAAIFERDIDRNLKDEVIHRIAGRTNCSFEEVKSTSIRYFEYKLYDPNIKKSNSMTKWVLPIGRQSFKHNMKGLMFCPGCLTHDAEMPYYRKKWRLALTFACVECGCYLYDCCPWCGSPICFFRNSIGLINQGSFKGWVTCFNCKKDLRKSNIKQAPDEVIEVQKKLYDILEFGLGCRIVYPIQYFDVLGFMVKILVSSRLRFQSLREDLLKYHKVPFFTSESNRPRFEALEYNKRIQVITVAHWLLEDWPNRFIFYCKKHGLCSTDALPDVKEAPFWYESVIKDEIYRPRNTQSEVPFGLYSIFGITNPQSGHHRRRVKF
ncbi:TniQ family protein [Paraflavisolibacter sp. H34]|uniref:TniQ family protein n=1 Tax=Huijunlia imazamoxiresistens TaxID=3127457 RepID=UPI00301892FC